MPTTPTAILGSQAGSTATGTVTGAGPELRFVCFVLERGDSTTPATPSSVSGQGVTWTLLETLSADAAGGFRRVGFLYWAFGTFTTGTVTCTPGYTTSQASCIHVRVTDTDTVAPYRNVVTRADGGEGEANAASTTPSVTLAAFAASSNSTLAVVAFAGSGNATEKSGWTKLGENGGVNCQVAAEWIASNDTTPSMTLGSAPFGSKITGIELVAAAGPTPNVVMSGAVHRASRW